MDKIVILSRGENMEYETRTQIDEKVLKVYRYGSRVYGCNKDNSDWDYIIVVESDKELYYSVELKSTNFTVYSEKMFIKRIKEHHISILECIFQDENDEYVKYFELDKAILRRAISSVASNSYGKCKKKIAQGDDYIGLKSLFHSLRILNFGIQIAKYGKITSYSSANVFYDMIFDIGSDWDKLHYQFKPIFNMLKTHFKKVAPLEGELHE